MQAIACILDLLADKALLGILAFLFGTLLLRTFLFSTFDTFPLRALLFGTLDALTLCALALKPLLLLAFLLQTPLFEASMLPLQTFPLKANLIRRGGGGSTSGQHTGQDHGDQESLHAKSRVKFSPTGRKYA